MKKLISLILVLAMILGLSVSVFAEEITPSTQKLTVDGKAAEFSAFNIDGYNYFRLRDLARILKGTECRFSVDYDAVSKTVSITTGADYTEDSAVYNLSNIDLKRASQKSTQTLLINGKKAELSAYLIADYNYFMLAELKAYLGFALDYDEASRTIQISTPVSDPRATAEAYAEIYQKLTAVNGVSSTRGDEAVEKAEAEAPVPMPSDNSTTAAKAAGVEYDSVAEESGSGSYSGTNVQVQGIDEGDIVKTDGKYIYVLRDGTELTILKADGAQTSVISRTEVGYYFYEDGNEDKYSYSSESKSANEMFISDGRLAVISDYYSFREEKTDTGWEYEDESYVCVDIYDVADPRKPVLMGTFGQDGNSRQTRMMDGTVYVVSDYWVYNTVEDEPETYIPTLYRNGRDTLMPAEKIYCGPKVSSNEFTVICAYDLYAASMSDSASLLGGCDQLYMNEKGIYVFDSTRTNTVTKQYKESVYQVTEHLNTSETQIARFALEDGLVLAATGSVPGYMDGQFSADEYNGYLRLVTTRNDSTYRTYEDAKYGFVNYQWDDSKTTNGLYVLDMELQVVGKVDELAEDEYVYSARFDGDIAYFCTYRSVDPLFAVDVSNPKAPKVMSALKLSGFSEYLHAWGSERLFGFGRETNEDTGWSEGLKLVMFNTADKENVFVENYLVLDANYSEALYNHKAFFIDSQKNLIGFLGDDDYYVFSYTENGGFKQLCHFWFDTYEWNVRGLWIDNWAYIVGSEQAMLLNMNTWGDPISLKLSK